MVRVNFPATIPLVVFCSILIGITWHFFSYLIRSNEVKLQSSGVERKYILKSPHQKSENLPLLIALHGYRDHPRLMELYSGFSRLSDKEKILVAYPYGTNSADEKELSWNAGSCCATALKKNVEDVVFIEDVIRDISSKHSLDRTKIYIVGFSNGAMMAQRMVSEKTSLFAGAAIVSGAIGGKVLENQEFYTTPRPSQAIPVFLLHGQEDQTVPFKGGLNKNKDANFTSFQDEIEFWKKNNNCKNDPIISENDDSFKKEYLECDNSTKVIAKSVKKFGHTWFGHPLEHLRHPLTQHTDASREIWEFFQTK